MTATNDGTGQAPTESAMIQDVAQKPACGLTTKIFSSFARLVNQTVYYMKKFAMDINI
jgi:hypothetical protein